MSLSALLSRVQALEAKANQTNSSSTAAASGAGGNWQLHSLDGTVLLTNSTGTSGLWATWDLTKQVPAGATHVLLEGWSYQNQPDGVVPNSFAYVRNGTNGTQFVAFAGRSSGTQDGTGNAMQGIFPIGSSRQLQYNVSTDFLAWQMRLVGWFG